MTRSRHCGRRRTALRVLLTYIVIDGKKMARRLGAEGPEVAVGAGCAERHGVTGRDGAGADPE